MKTKYDIKLKTGEVISAGTFVTLRPMDRLCEVITVEKTYKFTWLTVATKILGKTIPINRTLEKYIYDGICKSINGKTVEPDGVDSDGFPSWLIVMGMI